MSPLWTLEVIISASLGVASHLTIFILGEWNQYAAAIALFFQIAFVVLLLLSIVQELSVIRGLVLAIGLSFSYQLALVTSIVVYRTHFHRTCQFPGPTLDAVSKWAAAKRAKKYGRYHLELAHLHAKYGDIVRTGPMELSINSSEAVGALYRKESCFKGPWYDLGGTGQNLHRTRNRYLHDLQKPFWQQGLNDKALKAYISPIKTAVATLLENIDSHTEPVDMNAEFQVFAFKLMSTLTFSINFPLEGIEGTRKALSLLDQSQTLLSTFGHVPWVYAITKYIPRLLRSNAQFSNLANRLVERRKEIDPDMPDLFSHLLKAEHNPGAAGFPLSWEARLAIVVGSVNTSAALTAICFYLSTSQQTLLSLRAEVTPLIDSSTFDMRHPLPVLDSIIHESLRLQALIPSGEERKTPPCGLRIGPHTFIPGDVVVRVPNFFICRDERYFVRADDFIPERWTTRKDLVIDGSVAQPFGLGAYSCVGRELGLMEIRAVIANLAAAYTWRLDDSVDPKAWEFTGKDHFAMVFEALPLVFEKRKSNG